MSRELQRLYIAALVTGRKLKVFSNAMTNVYTIYATYEDVDLDDGIDQSPIFICLYPRR